jgi:hypothetical protein
MRRGHRVVLRAAACLLLSVIALDVAADAACDSIGLGAPSASTTAVRGLAPSGANEPCADFCIPDCFCCSRSVAAGAAVLPPEPQRLTAVPAPATDDLSEGVRTVPEPPPLALS